MSVYHDRIFISFASIYGYGFTRSTHIVMAYVRTLLVVQSFMSTKAEASDCVAIKQKHAMYGWTCQPFDHKDITNVPYHHCSLTCAQNHGCQAFVYDKAQRLCMMLSNPCVWTQPNADHVYGISKQQCFSWEYRDKDYPFYWYYEGSGRSYVGRRLHRGDMLVGKVTNNFNTVDPYSFSKVNGGITENLVVDPSCQVAWVPYDANSGLPLPDDALIGGVLSATNTPLYVVRQQSGTIRVTGYYNPLVKLAWGETWISSGVVNNTVFEIMTITRRWQCWLSEH